MKEEGTHYEGNWEEQYAVESIGRMDGGRGGGGGGAALPKPHNNQAQFFSLRKYVTVCFPKEEQEQNTQINTLIS